MREMPSQFRVSKSGEPDGNQETNADEPEPLASDYFVQREQEESRCDGKIPPGVKSGTEFWKAQLGAVQYSVCSVGRLSLDPQHCRRGRRLRPGASALR